MPSRRTFLTHTLPLAALLVAGCRLSGLTPTPPPDAPVTLSGGTLTLSLGEDFITFHPFLEVNHTAHVSLLFEAPIHITGSGRYEPWLAESWQESDDGLSLTLTLRSGVRFHNGRDLSADDLVWSLNVARDADAGHHLSNRFRTVSSVAKLDDRSVRITYSERSGDRLDALAKLTLFPREAADNIATAPVGTGPFRFVEWIPGDRVTLDRFPDYWLGELPYLDRVVLRAVPDARARVSALRLRTLDLAYDLPLGQRGALAAQEGIVVADTPPGPSFYAFIMNTRVPPFDRQSVRQAFHFALDRAEIVATAFGGQATPVTVPLPSTSWAYPADLADAYPHDPVTAHLLLAQAGYPAGFRVRMLVRDTTGPFLEQGRVFARQLAEIGVEVELVPAPPNEFWPRLYDGDFALVSHKTGDVGADPSALFERAGCCRTTNSFFGIEGRSDDWFVEYAAAIESARRSPDQAERARLYHRALEIWQEQAWTIPTVWDSRVYAHWDDLHGVEVDLDGALRLHAARLTRPTTAA